MSGERAHATAPRTGTEQHAAPTKPGQVARPLLAALHRGAGDGVVSRLIQRKEIGPHGKKTDGKQVPDRVAPVSQMTVEGTASESLYSPDHVAG